MPVQTRDPIAGLVLAVCEYLRVVDKGNPTETTDARMRMFTKALAVERAYGRNTVKKDGDGS